MLKICFFFPTGNCIHFDCLFQTQRMAEAGDEDSATKWLHVVVQPEPCQVPQRWLLLEKEEGRQKYPRGPHEAESPGIGGLYGSVID
jgi:hypothetical protein